MNRYSDDSSNGGTSRVKATPQAAQEVFVELIHGVLFEVYAAWHLGCIVAVLSL